MKLIISIKYFIYSLYLCYYEFAFFINLAVQSDHCHSEHPKKILWPPGKMKEVITLKNIPKR